MCALGGAVSNVADPVVSGDAMDCVAYLLAAFFVTLTWYVPQLKFI